MRGWAGGLRWHLSWPLADTTAQKRKSDYISRFVHSHRLAPVHAILLCIIQAEKLLELCSSSLRRGPCQCIVQTWQDLGRRRRLSEKEYEQTILAYPRVSGQCTVVDSSPELQNANSIRPSHAVVHHRSSTISRILAIHSSKLSTQKNRPRVISRGHARSKKKHDMCSFCTCPSVDTLCHRKANWTSVRARNQGRTEKRRALNTRLLRASGLASRINDCGVERVRRADEAQCSNPTLIEQQFPQSLIAIRRYQRLISPHCIQLTPSPASTSHQGMNKSDVQANGVMARRTHSPLCPTPPAQVRGGLPLHLKRPRRCASSHPEAHHYRLQCNVAASASCSSLRRARNVTLSRLLHCNQFHAPWSCTGTVPRSELSGVICEHCRAHGISPWEVPQEGSATFWWNCSCPVNTRRSCTAG